MSDAEDLWLRLTIEQASDAVLFVDESGTIRQINPAFEALSGWVEQDLVGQPLHAVFEPGSARGATTRSARAQPVGRQPDRPRPWRHRDGSLFWVEVVALTLRRPDNGIRGCLHVLRAVSDRMRRAEAWTAAKDAMIARHAPEAPNAGLSRSEEHFRNLYEGTPAILHSIDAAGRLVIVSDAWLSMMGYERGEVIGRPSIDFLTPESRRYALDVVLPAFRETGRCHDIAYQFVKKTGEIRDVELSATSQLDDAGRFIRSLAVLLDVTERKKIERMLIARTAALQRSNDDLRRIAKIAAHDLQEPLRRVITYSDVLKEDFGAELSEGAARIADIIQSGGRRLRLMINGLHDYVVVRDQLDHGFEPVDLSAVACHARDDLKAEIASKDVRIEIEHLPPGLGPGADPADGVSPSLEQCDQIWLRSWTGDKRDRRRRRSVLAAGGDRPGPRHRAALCRPHLQDLSAAAAQRRGRGLGCRSRHLPADHPALRRRYLARPFLWRRRSLRVHPTQGAAGWPGAGAVQPDGACLRRTFRPPCPPAGR
ncbi:MAG: PAS domain S-box protein [Rhizobiales bacterium]|nr:PAS domain S-box protein [Hyphomicrobiales bacterium]